MGGQDMYQTACTARQSKAKIFGSFKTLEEIICQPLKKGNEHFCF
jgi:hypothetical protein